jgi:ribosomal protein S18 acetylase RimI-like enzyme
MELNQTELSALHDFINRNETQKITLEQLHKRFENKYYDFGKGLLVMLDNENVVAKSQLLYHDFNRTAYIRNIDIIEKHSTPKTAIGELITHGINTARAYGALNIYIGVREERIKSIIDELNYTRSYQTLVMMLPDRALKQTPLQLIKLEENNKYEYINIYNEAFSDAPNGGIISVQDVDAYLHDASAGKYYFIVQAENQNIGMLEIDMEDIEDIFTIGLKREWRSKGYGKRLLETAIDFLNQKEVEEICLMVISRNKRAYEMYLKRGFVVKKVYTDWYVLG